MVSELDEIEQAFSELRKRYLDANDRAGNAIANLALTLQQIEFLKAHWGGPRITSPQQK